MTDSYVRPVKQHFAKCPGTSILERQYCFPWATELLEEGGSETDEDGSELTDVCARFPGFCAIKLQNWSH